MPSLITAAMLYDLVQCPHRPAMDLFGDPAKRDETNAFVQLLWERGTAHEREVIDGLTVPILDLSRYSGNERERQTFEAMQRGEPLIYSARITADDLLGYPDLLRREGKGYVAGDIKSGSGKHGGDSDDGDAKLKKHYGVQLALYTDILERRGLASSRRPFVWDIRREEAPYDLEEEQGRRKPWTMWDVYQETLASARRIVARTKRTAPAYSSACKLCHWHTACLAALEESDDLTLLPDLGRAKRDEMVGRIPTVSDLAAADVNRFVVGEKIKFQGSGADSLRKFHRRAKLAKTAEARPCLTGSPNLPPAGTELFFDVEVDPMRGFCYLHGFVERRNGDNETEKYIPFFADAVSREEEEDAFAEAWGYIDASPASSLLFEVRAHDLAQATGQIPLGLHGGRHRGPVWPGSVGRPLL